MYLTCPPLQCLNLCEVIMTFNVVITCIFLIYFALYLRKRDNIVETFLTRKLVKAFFVYKWIFYNPSSIPYLWYKAERNSEYV